MQKALDVIPSYIIDGMGVASAILPAIGFALLLQMMLSKKLAVFFFLGFLLVAYLNVSVIGVVAFSVVVVLIMFFFGGNSNKVNAMSTSGEEVDDNEF